MSSNELEAYFFCSSKHGVGYVWSRIRGGSFESCSGVGNEFVDTHMSISGMDFFVFKEGIDNYIVVKSIPNLCEDRQQIVDISMSKIYINLVLKTRNEILARQIAIFIVSHFKSFSEICYQYYNAELENDILGYEFDPRIIEDLIANVEKITVLCKDETSKLEMQKMTEDEIIGRLCGYSLHEGINIACLMLSENEFIERYSKRPILIFEKLKYDNIKINKESLKNYIQKYQNAKKKEIENKKIIFLFLIILILGVLLICNLLIW